MPLVNIGQLIIPMPNWPTSTAGTNLLVDAASERAWGIYEAPKSGNISRIHFRTGTVTTGATIDLRMETIDASGQPSGTLWATNTNIAHVLNATDDNITVRSAAFTAVGAVTTGQVFALVIANPAASFGNFNIVAGRSAPIGIAVPGFPHSGGPLNTNKTSGLPSPFLFEYDDGTVFGPTTGMPGPHVPTNITINTTTNPDEAGLLFTAPTNMRAIGFALYINMSGGITYRVNLYESGNNTPILTRDYDSDETSTTAAVRAYIRLFSGTATLRRGVQYRLAFVPLSTTGYVITVAVAGANSYFDYLGLPGAQYTARNRSGTTDPDAAAWTETATQRPFLSLLVDQIDDGTGIIVPRFTSVR